MFKPSVLLLGCLRLSLCAACLALDLNADPKPSNGFCARGIGYPLENGEKVFRPDVISAFAGSTQRYVLARRHWGSDRR